MTTRLFSKQQIIVIVILLTSSTLITLLRCDSVTSSTHIREARRFELIYILQEKPNHMTHTPLLGRTSTEYASFSRTLQPFASTPWRSNNSHHSCGDLVPIAMPTSGPSVGSDITPRHRSPLLTQRGRPESSNPVAVCYIGLLGPIYQNVISTFKLAQQGQQWPVLNWHR